MAESDSKQCANCETTISDYTPEYIRQLNTKYGNIKEFQTFLNQLKINPELVHDVCLKCQSVKWQNSSHNQVKRPAPSSDSPRKSSSHNKRTILFVLVVILAILLGYLSNTVRLSYVNTRGWSDDDFRSTIVSLKNKFPALQPGFQRKLSGALSRLRTPGEPIVFMLLHDDTNKKSTDCLASYASVLAKKFIFNTSPTALWLDGSQWTRYSEPENDDLLLEKLNAPLVENEVLVVENLQDLPWSQAKSLHHLCDTENPTYAKAMYVLELRVNGDTQQLNDSQQLVAAERTMHWAWRDAPKEFVQPLITRLTSYVDAVTWKSDTACTDESFIRIVP